LFGGFWAVGAETIIGKWPYDVKAIEAYRCRKCNLIIFRYEKQNKKGNKQLAGLF